MTQAAAMPAPPSASAAAAPPPVSARKPEWAPRIWEGCDFFAWLKLLYRNRFAVEFRYWYIAVIVTFVSFKVKEDVACKCVIAVLCRLDKAFMIHFDRFATIWAPLLVETNMISLFYHIAN